MFMPVFEAMPQAAAFTVAGAVALALALAVTFSSSS
jgi:hypothetical protein